VAATVAVFSSLIGMHSVGNGFDFYRLRRGSESSWARSAVMRTTLGLLLVTSSSVYSTALVELYVLFSQLFLPNKDIVAGFGNLEGLTSKRSPI
jgi:hypothetical protein